MKQLRTLSFILCALISAAAAAADLPISSLTASPGIAAGDLFPCVDISDTTAASTGTTKKCTATQVQSFVLGNAFTQFTGPTTSAKTFTLPNASATILTDNALVTAAQGGTGNGFTQFTGPTTSTKTFTLPNATSTILTTNAAVTAAQGGTGNTTYTDGQLLIGNSSGNTLTKATLTAGTNVTITNGNGSITIAASGGGGGSSDLLSTLVNTEVAVTTTATLTLSKMHVMSGSSAYTVTLPACTTAGTFVGGRITNTNLITLKGNASELIDGVNTRILWKGESFIVQCDGTSWFKIAGKTIPLTATIYLNAATNMGASGGLVLVPFDTTLIDNSGLMATLGSNGITIKRPSNYTVKTVLGTGPHPGADLLVEAVALKGSTQIASGGCGVLNSGGYALPNAVADFIGAAADLITVKSYHDTSQTVPYVVGAGGVALSVTEIPAW